MTEHAEQPDGDGEHDEAHELLEAIHPCPRFWEEAQEGGICGEHEVGQAHTGGNRCEDQQDHGRGLADSEPERDAQIGRGAGGSQERCE